MGNYGVINSCFSVNCFKQNVSSGFRIVNCIIILSDSYIIYDGVYLICWDSSISLVGGVVKSLNIV